MGIGEDGCQSTQVWQPDRINDEVSIRRGELDEAHALPIGVKAVGFGVDGDDRTGSEGLDESVRVHRRRQRVRAEAAPRWTSDSYCGGSDAPICQDTRSGGLDDRLASAEIGHDALVDLASEDTFQHRMISRVVRPAAVRRATSSTVG